MKGKWENQAARLKRESVTNTGRAVSSPSLPPRAGPSSSSPESRPRVGDFQCHMRPVKPCRGAQERGLPLVCGTQASPPAGKRAVCPRGHRGAPVPGDVTDSERVGARAPEPPPRNPPPRRLDRLLR